MACELKGTLLHGYLDRELDAARATEFERHLETCPECLAALEAEESMRSAMQRQQLYERAPDTLRRKVTAGIRPKETARSFPRRPYLLWLAAAAGIILAAYIGWISNGRLGSRSGENVLAAEIVDAHLRSLQPGHLTDVTSTDQHTVKPWFDGKIDFAPPVRDFAEQGFPLLGGRLDIIDGRTVAALVYGRRKHLMSVFVSPTREISTNAGSGSQRGYQWMCWENAGMRFWIVADTSAADLEQLRQLLEH